MKQKGWNIEKSEKVFNIHCQKCPKQIQRGNWLHQATTATIIRVSAATVATRAIPAMSVPMTMNKWRKRKKRRKENSIQNTMYSLRSGTEKIYTYEYILLPSGMQKILNV